MTIKGCSIRIFTFAGILIALGGSGAGRTPPPHQADRKGMGNSPPASRILCEKNYTLTVRVRPLLFWISRPGVGGGRITWTEEADGRRGVELLIGSDPDRTPMRINRWGYVAERFSGAAAELLGVMTASEEQSIEQAKMEVSRMKGTHLFKAIKGSITPGEAQSTVTWLQFDQDFTFRDLAALLQQIPPSNTPTRQMPIPPGTEPGFLYSLRRMVHDTVQHYRQTGQVGTTQPVRRRYVYYDSLFELTLHSTRFLSEVDLNGHKYRSVLESEFEARKQSTGKTSRFSLAYGTEEPLEEIPIRIIYRPRWWFESELQLEGRVDTALTSGGGTSWNPGSH